MAKGRIPARKPRKNGNGFVLPPEQLVHREKVFIIYRDMGRRRSFSTLEKELKRDYPDLAAARTTLERWGKIHQWRDRVAQHDQGVFAGVGVAVELGVMPDMPAEFNQVEQLTLAAQAALMKAIAAAPQITKPGEMKAMIDAAANALLADTISKRRTIHE